MHNELQFQMNLLQSSCKPLDKMLVQQANKLKNTKISSFVKELLLLFITTPQINPTTYCIYGNKEKKKPQTFPYCNYGYKKKMNPPRPHIILMTIPKNGWLLNFFYY
jgi:hypothetical protein